jgi:hypothetical protein
LNLKKLEKVKNHYHYKGKRIPKFMEFILLNAKPDGNNSLDVEKQITEYLDNEPFSRPDIT